MTLLHKNAKQSDNEDPSNPSIILQNPKVMIILEESNLRMEIKLNKMNKPRSIYGIMTQEIKNSKLYQRLNEQRKLLKKLPRLWSLKNPKGPPM